LFVKTCGLGRILWIPFRIISPADAEKSEDSDWRVLCAKRTITCSCTKSGHRTRRAL